ncbi:MAG: YIP1 family protein [Pseudomonadota bacterium]
MAISTNISATYRGPGRVVRRLLDLGQREDRALAYLMGGCLVMFIAQMPRLSRQAHLESSDLHMLLGGALLGWIFIAPLGLYLIAALSHLGARVFGGRGSYYGARLALFWALLAASPLFLLNGLVAGFVGPGLELNAVGSIWTACFLWFWIRGLVVAEQGTA